MRVGVPVLGTGEREGPPHGRPKPGTMPTDMKKAAMQAACPPSVRDANLASLMCSDICGISHRPVVRQGAFARLLANPGARRKAIGWRQAWARALQLAGRVSDLPLARLTAVDKATYTLGVPAKSLSFPQPQ